MLHLQNAIKTRKSAATRVARHVQRDRVYPQSCATKFGTNSGVKMFAAIFRENQKDKGVAISIVFVVGGVQLFTPQAKSPGDIELGDAGNHRKPQILAGNRRHSLETARKLQIGVCHLRSVT